MGRQVGITANVHARSLFDVVLWYHKLLIMLVSTLESLCLERGIFCDICKGLACIRTPCWCLLNTRLNFKSLLNPSFNLFTSLQIHSLRYGALRSVIFILNESFFLSHFRPVTWFIAWPLLLHLLRIQPTLTRSSTTNRWLQPDNNRKAMRKMKGISTICR